MNQRSSPAKAGVLDGRAKRIKVNGSQNCVWRGKAKGRTRPAGSERLRRRQDLVRMARHFHFAPDLGDAAVAVNEKGRALDAEIFAAVHALFLPYPVGLDRGAIGG